MTIKLVDPVVCPQCRVELQMTLVHVAELLPAGAYTRYEALPCCGRKLSVDILVNVDDYPEPKGLFNMTREELAMVGEGEAVPQADGF